MSPLADATYAALRRHLLQTKSPTPVISYGLLCPKIAGFRVGPRSGKLHDALGEIVVACRTANLAAIAALAINGTTKIPGGGYFPVAHAGTSTDAARRSAWAAEVAQVVRDKSLYPPTLP